MDVQYSLLDSPVGVLLLTQKEGALTSIYMGATEKEIDPSWVKDDQGLSEVRQQLTEYFEGKRKSFELTLSPEGTAFQKKVWQELQKIPYATTISYGELARRVGDQKASRAVGLANGKNPIPIVIPCHRVIGASGALTGYGGGLPRKQALLALERGEQKLL